MKSSSALFPVSLFKAELRGSLTEDTYLIKHNRDSDRSVEVALTRLGRIDEPHRGQPVILVHGSFSNRSFWISKGSGLGNYLLDQGFDVWVMEHRGHGMSPINNDYKNNTVARYAQFDIPAVQEFVEEQSGQAVIWGGHSLGGVIIATAMAAQTLSTKPKAVFMAGTQLMGRPWYLWPGGVGGILRRIIKYRGAVGGRELGIGPEDEPAGVIMEYLSRVDWLGRWEMDRHDEDGLMPGWQTLDIPLLGISATSDKTDSARKCRKFYQSYNGPLTDLELGTKTGFAQEYDHLSMLLSSGAQKEVYPWIRDWLLEFSSDN